ncbi:MAG: tetratricopeptide repeat protein [Gammaproteobacteria bacterium]|nr:tetratricopeptide repeat protein [Gammaproteobacteria bacterium]MDP2140488.1 tetratricopeptide repeat protein [Gammaproteobacteria bacterium]MDP2348797.1 tetratricopeptide repeat protein [Gammaproteobacteria bacterium]
MSNIFTKRILGTVVMTTLVVSLTTGHVAHADYEAGITAAQNGDFATALREFTEAAEAGLDLAQFNLAILYYTGQGVEQSYEEAYRWTLAAAEQGHLNAQANLASLHYYGTGTTQNYKEALRWNTTAAEYQHAGAQLSLAKMYQLGEGTEVDLLQAHFWASAALHNEHPEAGVLLRQISALMDPEQLSQARRMFAEWVLAL